MNGSGHWRAILLQLPPTATSSCSLRSWVPSIATTTELKTAVFVAGRVTALILLAVRDSGSNASASARSPG